MTDVLTHDHEVPAAMKGPEAERPGYDGITWWCRGSLAQSTMDGFLSAIRGVARGESHIPNALLTPVLMALRQSTPPPNQARLRLDRLSPREDEILTLMIKGLDRHLIAEQLGLSVNTVRTHVKNILQKLEVHSSLEAVSVALLAGERPDPDS